MPVTFVSELRSHETPASHRASPRQDAGDNGDEQRIAQALAIWCETRPLRGTLAETYLRSRYIEVPDEARDVLRFHPACPWEERTRPALVALVCDVITDEPIGIHRTALSIGGAKIAPKVLGLKDGGAIKLSRPITTELMIAEGIETALSATILGFGPAWSVIDAGEMAKLPVLPGIERLTVMVDHDVSGAGQKAAATVRARWEAAGLRVRTVTPATPGHDANNVLVALECRS